MKNSLLALAFVSLASSVSWSYDYYSSYSSNYNEWSCAEAWRNGIFTPCYILWYEKDCSQIEGEIPARLKKIDELTKKITNAYEIVENKPASGSNYYQKYSMLSQLKDKGSTCLAIRAEILSTMTRRFR